MSGSNQLPKNEALQEMNTYLFVYASLSLGGVETFFVRLAKQFEKKNIRLRFLFLFKGSANVELMRELMKYADILYWEDMCFLGKSKHLSPRIKALMPPDRKALKSLFSDVDAVHVSCALTYFSAMRIFSVLNTPVKCVFGVYHSNELAWGRGDLPGYERYFRNSIFEHKSVTLLFFNDVSREITLKNNNVSHDSSRTFPLGVDLPTEPRLVMAKQPGILRVVSVGRLTEFKTYNLSMMSVVHKLASQGVDIQYHVYGSGSLQQRMLQEIDHLGLKDHVVLHGDLSYSLLDKTLKAYDVFVGSGTALLHAAANGVPCIAAIENEPAPKTYGFFSDLSGSDYHEQTSSYEKKTIFDVLMKFESLDNVGRAVLEHNHFLKSKSFDIETCAANFKVALDSAPVRKCSKISFYKYMGLFFIAEFVPRVLGKSLYRKKYDHVI